MSPSSLSTKKYELWQSAPVVLGTQPRRTPSSVVQEPLVTWGAATCNRASSNAIWDNTVEDKLVASSDFHIFSSVLGKAQLVIIDCYSTVQHVNHVARHNIGKPSCMVVSNLLSEQSPECFPPREL